MSQTTIQKNNSIRFGSIRLEIGESLSSLVDVGALRDISLKSKAEVTALQFDNTPEIKTFIDGDKFSLDATLVEINANNLALLNKNWVEITSVAGTPVSGATQTLANGAWKFDEVYELEGQNADGTAPTINSVTGSTDGATSDYTLVKLGNGNWGIAIKSGGSITTEAQDVVVDYDYTPSASKKVTFKTNGILGEMFMRITNTNQDGKKWTKTFKGVANITPLEISYPSDHENEVATTPISLEGYVIDWVDEQQTT